MNETEPWRAPGRDQARQIRRYWRPLMDDNDHATPFDPRTKADWAELPTGEKVELGGIGARVGARLLDLIFVWAALTGMVLLISVPLADTAGAWLGTLGVLVVYALGIGYEPVQTALWGRTLGKRIVGIRVVHASHGGLPGWGRAFGRWAFAGLLWLTFFGGPLCYLSPTWDRVRQGWHDKVSGTLVVNARAREVPRPTTNPFSAPPAE